MASIRDLLQSSGQDDIIAKFDQAVARSNTPRQSKPSNTTSKGQVIASKEQSAATSTMQEPHTPASAIPSSHNKKKETKKAPSHQKPAKAAPTSKHKQAKTAKSKGPVMSRRKASTTAIKNRAAIDALTHSVPEIQNMRPATPSAPKADASWTPPPLREANTKMASNASTLHKLQSLQNMFAPGSTYNKNARVKVDTTLTNSQQTKVTVQIRSTKGYTLACIRYVVKSHIRNTGLFDDLYVIRNPDPMWTKAVCPNAALCKVVRQIEAESKKRRPSTAPRPTPSSNAAAPRPASTLGAHTTVILPSASAQAAPAPADARTIGIHTLVVRCHYGGHDKHGHMLTRVTALVNVLPRRGGDIHPVQVRAYWCPKCNQYFLLEDDYLALKRKGIICCRVIEQEAYLKDSEPARDIQLAQVSIIHSYGYNVRADNGLTELDRQDILAFLIENHIQTAQEIAGHLEWCIDYMGRSPSRAAACAKWQADLEYVRNYRPPVRQVKVDAIFATRW